MKYATSSKRFNTMSASHLHFELLEASRYIPVLTGLRLQLEEHSQCPCALTVRLEDRRELVEQRVMRHRSRCRRFDRALVPFDGVHLIAGIQIGLREHRAGAEAVSR